MFTRGKLIWTVCFALLLLSTPLLIRDLLVIQRGVEQSSGADFWYEGQLNRELLLLKLILLEASRPDGPTNEDLALQIDLVFSRLNTLPVKQENGWHSMGLAMLQEAQLIRDELEAIDHAMPLLEADRPAFLKLVEAHVDTALEYGRALALRVVERQNTLAGELQHRFGALRQALLAYGIGFLFLLLGLGYLMVHHIRSERDLRASNQRLTEMAERLGRARDDALEASRAKGRFLANASHELRTPLNGIIGFAEMLRDGYTGALNERQREYIDDIHGSANRLLALINDILDLSKLEAGKQTLAEETVALDEIARRAVHDMRETIRQAEVQVRVAAKVPLPAIRGDAAKLRQVVDNLLSNAVKFTRAGGTIHIDFEQASQGGLVLTVADTGIGIDREEIPKVFKAFEQVDSAYARKHKGTGLGLPLAKGFVELHGGSLSIESEAGVGTTVRIALPASRVVAQSPKAEQRMDMKLLHR